MQFQNYSDAGAQLGALVRVNVPTDAPWVFCPVVPHGVAVLDGMASSGWPVPILPLEVERTADGARVAAPPAAQLAGRCVIVVDDGVETGTVARAAAVSLREIRPARLVLAVPVCSREAMAQLQHLYDQIVAVDRPLVRRDLRWHYDDMGPGAGQHLT
jgi:putative phosphoribosyl transferase